MVKEKFTPIKDEELASLSHEQALQRIGGIHLTYMALKFPKEVSLQMAAGFAAAIEAKLPLSDVVVVIADRRNKFFESYWTEEVKAFETDINVWWVFKHTLRAMGCYSDTQHEFHSEWNKACEVSEYGLNCLVILGNHASVQFIQPMPDKPDNANDAVEET